MPQAFGKVNRLLPSAQAENAQAQVRTFKYSELFSVPVGHGLYPLCQEGTYFKTTNPTFGTGIASSIQTSFLATNALLSIHNGASGGGVFIVLDYLRLIVTVAGTSTTSVQAALAIDGTTRYSSGGTSITALVGSNMDVVSTSVATVHFGALTLSAASGNVRYLSRFNLRAVIPVVNEEFVISFGRPVVGSFNTMGGATAQRMAVDAGPVIIGPGEDLELHVWNPANVTTPPSYEFEMGWFER